MYNLKIISSSVRPGRKGPIVGRWITEKANAFGGFNTEFIDLGELNLPQLDEPEHPSLQKYQHEHTKKWSAKINEADAFIFVTAEYNHSYPGSLKTAIDFLFKEWGYKPAGIVSYGGISAGTRAAWNLKAALSSMKIVPLLEAVNIPNFQQYINDKDMFVPIDSAERGAETMLKELTKWTKGLKAIRDAG